MQSTRDNPSNVVFGELVSQNRGPRLDSPCRLFAGLGFLPPFAENIGKTLCFCTSELQKKLENLCFARKCKEMRGGHRKST